MRLLQSILARLPMTKPQRTFLAHFFGLVLLMPGRITFRNLSRYSPSHEKTFARWYATGMEWASLNKAAITDVVPADHAQTLVMDASFIPKSGKQTYGLDRFWNSTHSRTEQGLELSAVAWLDVTNNCAYCLHVAQTPPAAHEANADATRIDFSVDHLTRIVTQQDLAHLRYVVTDGYYSKKKFLDGVRALGLHQIGKLRADANPRYLYSGPQWSGPGRPKTYDGKVHWAQLARLAALATGEEYLVLYHQVVNHVQFKRDLCVVLLVDTRSQRQAVLFSTDVTLDALTLYRYYKARFQIEFLFRDAKQFMGLTDCQVRSQAKLAFHFNASLTAVTLAKLDAQQQRGNTDRPLSMASLKRRAFNQHLIERICVHLDSGVSLDKSSPDYDILCNYGTLTDLAA